MEQRLQYDEDGWIAPIDIMSGSEATEVLAALQTAEARYPDELHAEQRNNAHLMPPFLADLVRDPRIIDPVESIIGGDISLGSTVLFIEEPSSSSFVSWHQDAFYMGLNNDNFVTACADVRPVRGDHQVLPIRGAQPDQAFVSVGPPTSDCDPEGLATRSGANAALSSVLYHSADTTRAL